MPGNLIGSTPNGVMPATLCTAFSELREYAQLQNQFHDGTIQRSQLAQTSRRTFHLSKRLSSSLLSALYSFWVSQNGGLTPFVFYNPFDVTSGEQIGSNYDPTGSNTQGRVTVKGYSLTDCISMQTMRKEGLTEVLTNDRHFEQEGFRALFRDS